MISKTHRIKFVVIRHAHNLNFGKNHWDFVDPREYNKLWQIIGKAGVNMADYAAFEGLNFNDELVNRNMTINNLKEVYFVHRGLLHLRHELIVEQWTVYNNRKGI